VPTLKINSTNGQAASVTSWAEAASKEDILAAALLPSSMSGLMLHQIYMAATSSAPTADHNHHLVLTHSCTSAIHSISCRSSQFFILICRCHYFIRTGKHQFLFLTAMYTATAVFQTDYAGMYQNMQEKHGIPRKDGEKFSILEELFENTSLNQ
jgi:hypothetical protein